MANHSFNRTAAPFARPLYVMLKPVGARCNLNCTYCYYLEKSDNYPDRQVPQMSEAMLETFTRQYLESQTMQPVSFCWHGGEPLLRGIDFYRKALKLQRQYGRGMQIENTLQTNGTLLTDEWCRFFREQGFLIGISIDGPPAFHDHYRKTAQGAPSFDRVMRGISLLQKDGVEYNIMAVVNDRNVHHPLEFYRFFKELGARYIQFAPIVETLPGGEMAPWNVPPEAWGDFLNAIFDEWVRQDVGSVFVHYFDCALANWVGVPPGICIFASECGHAGVMEYNGEVYSCDHFVFSEYRLGNILEQPLAGMMYSSRQQAFGQEKAAGLSSRCRRCRYAFACRGECPKNRIALTPEGEKINYLCRGYYRFFEHIAPYMEFMKRELEAERAPANIMDYLKTQPI